MRRDDLRVIHRGVIVHSGKPIADNVYLPVTDTEALEALGATREWVCRDSNASYCCTEWDPHIGCGWYWMVKAGDDPELARTKRNGIRFGNQPYEGGTFKGIREE